MFKNSDDTIAAIATATGAGGVGIIRLSGPEAGKILAFVCKRDIKKISDRYFYYGKVWSGDELLDEVLFVLMKGPRSFTGEDVAEIHAHGGSANLGRILRATMEAGARHAEAGEFSRRAFQNGRIDLTRAEAIVDIVNASSERALRVAQSQLAGQLGDEVSDIIENLTMLLAELEADIDFPEDEVPEQERARQVNTAQSLSQRCSKLGQSYGLGKRLQGGVDVVLRGEVNAGKSSLFNALVGEERAIVAAEAGTTRDFVEAQIVWRGIPITLVDTAGIRDGGGAIEDRGIAMGAERAARADLQIHVVESGASFPELGENAIGVWSKADLHPDAVPPQDVLSTSSENQKGIEAVKNAIVDRVLAGSAEAAEGIVVTNERQRSRLVAAAEAMSRAAGLIKEQREGELAIVDLREARLCLAEVTGVEVGDEVLDALFSRFCIGK